jgi:hypothetical protein
MRSIFQARTTRRGPQRQRIELDAAYISVYISKVGKTKLTGKLMHLEPEKAAMLEELARETGIKQSVLMREAIDALLIKHKLLKAPKRKP